jgi:TPR repeat protein
MIVGGLHELGYRYATGKSIGKDQEKAIIYYKRVFEKNGKEAQYAAANLGSAYLNGEGVPQSNKKAVSWFKIAAELGHSESQYNYGLSLVDAWDGNTNYKEGLYWLEKAAASGVVEAKESLVKFNEKI